MTSLAAVSSHLPETVPLADLGSELGFSEGTMWRFRRMYDLDRICRSTSDTEADLLVAAAGKLAGLAGQEDRVRYVVRARTIASPSPYAISSLRRACEALGLTRATAFAVTEHACASGLLAVDLCGTLLAEDGDPDALALILVGEKAFTPIGQFIEEVTIMGEGVAAVLVRAGGDRDRMLSYATRTHGRPDGDVLVDGEVAERFRRQYPMALAEVILAAVDLAGLSLSDIDLILPHNVNRVSWIRTAKDLGVPSERIFLDNVPETGHCFCADPFINYQTATELGRLRPGDRYLMTSVGLGATYSAMVFQH